MKSEPDVFSIDHLKKDKVSWWTGVRNYQARNNMKAMGLGDEILFYHSSCEIPGVVGLATVSKLAAPDQLQFDKKNEYFDKKSTLEKPIWFCVEVKYKSHFKKIVSLHDLKHIPELKNMPLLQRGSRLSVQPVSKEEFEIIKSLGDS